MSTVTLRSDGYNLGDWENPVDVPTPVSDDNDSTYVDSSTLGASALFDFAPFDFGGSTINSVTVRVRAETSGGDAAITVYQHVDGVDGQSDTFSIADDIAGYTGTLSVLAPDGLVWIQGDIDNFQVRVVYESGVTPRLTELFADVVYDMADVPAGVFFGPVEDSRPPHSLDPRDWATNPIGQKLMVHYGPQSVGRNVYMMTDGRITSDEPTPQERSNGLVRRELLGAHYEPVTAQEHALLIAAGYGAYVS